MPRSYRYRRSSYRRCRSGRRDFCLDAARLRHVIAGLNSVTFGPTDSTCPKLSCPMTRKSCPGGRGAIFGGVDFFVGAIDTDAQNPHQHAPSFGNFIKRGFG